MTFQEFFIWWKDQKENIGRSFTYGNALYDYMVQGFEDPDADYMIFEYVAWKLGISYEKTEELPYRAVIEIPDISVFDEIARYLYCKDWEDENTN